MLPQPQYKFLVAQTLNYYLEEQESALNLGKKPIKLRYSLFLGIINILN